MRIWNFLTVFGLVAALGFPSLLSAQPASSPSPMADSGIEGVISISPIRPGPIRADMPSSKGLADTEFVVTKGDKTLASFKTDGEGKFRVALPPGHYVVGLKEKRAARIGHFGPWEVEVAAGQMAKVDWRCDSGMR